MTFFPSFPEGTGLKEIQAPYAEMYKHWAKFSQALMRGPGPLTVAEREVIAAYTSGLNSCTYCYRDHTMAAEEFGVQTGVIESLVDDVDTAPVDDKMKPLLRYVRKLTLTPSRLVAGDAEAVFAAGWDEAALHFTIAICARFNLINRLILGHGIKYSEALTETWKTAQGLSYHILDKSE